MTSTSMPRKLGRLLPWLPLLVPIVGAILIIWSMVFTLMSTSLSAITPYFGNGLPESHHLPWFVSIRNQNGLPEFSGPELDINVSSINLVSRSISVRMFLLLDNATVAHLRIITGTASAPVPLTTVPQRLWANVPIKIVIGPCIQSTSTESVAETLQYCGGPIVTVPLGQVINPAGVPGYTNTLVSLPAYGAPVRFPSDSYVVHTTPAVLFENPVFLDTGHGGHPNDKYYLPSNISIAANHDVANYTITAVDVAKAQPVIIGLVISRPLVTELTVYVTAILPLLLALVLALVWVGRDNRDERPAFDIPFAAGLIAAMLAILPLRAVLVPSDLGYDSLTFVDDILLIAVMFIAGLMFWQYARFATRSSQEGIKRSKQSKPSAEGGDAS